MAGIRQAYLTAAATAAELLADPGVPARWAAPSVLPEFGVRGLAGHLAAQIFQVRQVLAVEVPDEPAIDLLEHYARASWAGAELDDEANVRIRQTGAEVAGSDAGALAARVTATLDELRVGLPMERADRLVHLPWGPWSLRLDDFLVTRMMEIAVHSDDLAVSVGLPTPELPEEVLAPVFNLLTRLAVRRHGPTALLRALTRAERAPTSIAAI